MTVFIILHAISGLLAILSGGISPFFRKGGKAHKLIGITFLLSMLVLGISGFVVAWLRDIPLSLLNGLFICYFVLSSYQAIKQPANSTNRLDWYLLGFVSCLFCGFIYFAIMAKLSVSGQLAGFGPLAFIAFACVAAFCLIADVRYIKKGGVAGRQRLIRHLWRMFFPLFMATAAFFLGQARLFPDALRQIEFLLLPVIIVILMMVFWLIKVRFSQWFVAQGFR